MTRLSARGPRERKRKLLNPTEFFVIPGKSPAVRGTRDGMGGGEVGTAGSSPASG